MLLTCDCPVSRRNISDSGKGFNGIKWCIYFSKPPSLGHIALQFLEDLKSTNKMITPIDGRFLTADDVLSE